MKRHLVIIIGVVIALILGSTLSVTAQSDNAALIVRVDGACEWYLDGLVAVGDLQYVETSNGTWTLACHGELVYPYPPSSAVTGHSSDANPLGGCFTPFGTTLNWTAVFSPDGSSRFICQGDLTPY